MSVKKVFTNLILNSLKFFPYDKLAFYTKVVKSFVWCFQLMFLFKTIVENVNNKKASVPGVPRGVAAVIGIGGCSITANYDKL